MSAREMARTLAVLQRGGFSTAIQRIDYPIHKGAPNPYHGMYYFVGSVPAACIDIKYATQEEAIAAAIAAGATRIQRADCSFVVLS
jgi:GH43 family beta-xylosidase